MHITKTKNTQIGKFSGSGIINHGVAYIDVGGTVMDVFFASAFIFNIIRRNLHSRAVVNLMLT